MSAAVSFESVTRAFGSNVALADASFDVPENSVCALLGPNGAGKTTSIRILLGLARADSGRVSVLGHPPGSMAVRRRLGYLPDVPAFPTWMTGEEYLESCALLTGAPGTRRIPALLEMAGLAGVRVRIGAYSRGMKQRLGIAQALIASPDLLVLDEPTSALDPAGRRYVQDLIARLAEHTTVILSSHNLAETERICTHAVVMRDGHVLAASPVSELRRRTARTALRIESDSSDRLAELLAGEPWVGHVRSEAGGLVVSVLSDEAYGRIPRMIADRGWSLYRLTPEEMSLEDAFLDLTKGRP
ncbi:MAG: ABC transporter ATP-binding protein [Actinomycetaceae bacterium]|nr:ABC transporter ATP-binding protein [Actinomycetaceae bacterium]